VTTKPALKGQMGSTVYYQSQFTARELVSSVRPARETDGWASMTIDDRMQREPNLVRIRKEIAPYLASHPDRFFGSLIVLVPKGTITFEPIESLIDLPAAYSRDAKNIGFITLGKGEHIALDGQHRLIALREVIQSKDSYGPLQHVVGDDEVGVIIIEFEEDKKTRTIFNKVNRHAKPTSASDNIITSETDGYAIVARRLLDASRGAPLESRVINGQSHDFVEWERTSLAKQSTKLITLAALYETVIDILSTAHYKSFSEAEDPVAPPEAQIDDAYELASEWWNAILEIPVFVDVLADPSLIPGIRFSATDTNALLLRPIGQIALVKGIAQAFRRNRGEVSVQELVRRASMLNWSPLSTNYWRDVIVKPDGRMIARKEAYALAASLIEYLISPSTVDDETQMELWVRWNSARGKVVTAGIDDLAPEEMPQDLPAPVV
jgi:DNA sulfur modification protein DndB